MTTIIVQEMAVLRSVGRKGTMLVLGLLRDVFQPAVMAKSTFRLMNFVTMEILKSMALTAATIIAQLTPFSHAKLSIIPQSVPESAGMAS